MKENGLKLEKSNGKPSKPKDEEISDSDSQKPSEKSKLVKEIPEKQQNLNEQVSNKPTKNSSDSTVGQNEDLSFIVNFRLDLMSLGLFVLAAFTRFYRLAEPKNIV